MHLTLKKERSKNMYIVWVLIFYENRRASDVHLRVRQWKKIQENCSLFNEYCVSPATSLDVRAAEDSYKCFTD